MNTLAIVLSPVLGGWAVRMTDGRELARFRGPGARFRALRYLHRWYGHRAGLLIPGA
jgi:hypothetical protein